MSYAEYANSLDQMMKVEKEREKEFKQSQKLVTEVDRQIFK
ncbi:hypothetical protein [Halobacillus sp. Marseille-P3879]|nr:hypothetical protein [Halobacillus sp. Marseille-P3879]